MIVLTLHRDVPLSREERAELPPGCYPVLSTGDVIARAELDLPVAHMVRFAVEMARAIPSADLEAEERPDAAGGAVLRAGALTDPFRTWMPALLRTRLPSAAALSTVPGTPRIDPGAIPEAPPEEPPERVPLLSEPAAEPVPPAAPPPGIPTRAVAAPSMPPELASFMDTLLSAPAVSTGGPTPAPPTPAPPKPTPAAPPAPTIPTPVAAPSGPDPWALLKRGKREAAEAAFKGHRLDDDGRQQVRELLASDSPEKVALGCRISRLTKWKSASAMIGRVLYRDEPGVRMEAVRALGVLAGSGMEPALHMLLRDAEPDVRRAAQRAINQIQRRGT